MIRRISLHLIAFRLSGPALYLTSGQASNLVSFIWPSLFIWCPLSPLTLHYSCLSIFLLHSPGLAKTGIGFSVLELYHAA